MPGRPLKRAREAEKAKRRRMLMGQLTDKEISELRLRTSESLYEFAADILNCREVLDPYFHGLVCTFAQHSFLNDYGSGDWYFPTRDSLVKSLGVLSSHCKIGDGKDDLRRRLQERPTCLDGSFRGVFIRLRKKSRNKISLMFRGSLKTTLNTMARELWMLVNDPTCRFFNAMNSTGNAKKVIRGMKSHLEMNPVFRAVYPEFVPEFLVEQIHESGKRTNYRHKYKWHANEFDIRIPEEFLDGAVGKREASVVGIGVGSRAVSQHYPHLNYDDLVDDKNAATPEQIDKIIQDYQAYQSLGIGEDTHEFYTGTPWDYSDLSQFLLDPSKCGIHNQCVMIATCEDVNGDPIYPMDTHVKRHPGLTKSKINKLRNQQSRGWLFSSQYLIQPISKAEQSFQPQWWKWYDPDKFKPTPSDITVISLDPAVSTQKQGDYSAFIVVTIDDKANWYVRDIIRHRALGEGATFATLCDLCHEYDPMTIAIEGVSFQRTYKYIIDEKIALGQFPDVHVQCVQPSVRGSKEWRIKKIVPRVQRGKVFLPAQDPNQPLHTDQQRYGASEGVQRLIFEGERFPRVSNDDVLDALCQIQELNLIPETWEGPEPELSEIQRIDKKMFGLKETGQMEGQWDPDLGYIW